MDSTTNTAKVTHRWNGTFPGVPLAGVTIEPADSAQLAAALERIPDEEIRDVIRARAGQLAGVGLVATLPYFKYLYLDRGMDLHAWPVYESRAYPIGVVADILAGPENPLVELDKRHAEVVHDIELEARRAAEDQERGRAHQEVLLGWERAGGLARAVASAPPRRCLPPDAPGVLLALAVGAVEESQAVPYSAAPAFDEEVNGAIRTIAHAIMNAQHTAQRDHY